MSKARILLKTSLRDGALLLVIAAIFASSWLIVSPSVVRSPRFLSYGGLHILSYAYATLLIGPLIQRSIITITIAVAGWSILLLLFVADLTTLRFFDAPFLTIYANLPVTIRNASIDVVLATINSYVPMPVWLLGSAAAIAGTACAYLIRNRNQARMVVLASMLIAYFASKPLNRWVYSSDPLVAALVEIPQIPAKPLRYASRDANFNMSATPLAEPNTILMVVVESAGANIPSSDGTTTLGERIMRGSGSNNWIRFPYALTNSNATDVSIPSMLTGSGPHESVDKLHSLPILSQFARERGYETEFITSSTLNWAGFEPFLRSGRFDKITSAADAHMPFINDLTVDDHFAYSRAASTIARARGKLFVLLYVNAMHLPFQSTSAFSIPADLTDRRARAAHITEAGFDMVFDSLKRSGRLEDALVIVTADHGEFGGGLAMLNPSKRLQTFDEPILSPIFAIKQPAGLPEKYRQAMERNSKRVISNLDLAPTLAHFLGANLRDGLDYTGNSLLGNLPPNRLVISSASSEWRQWPSTAIAVSREDERLLCDERKLCRRVTFKDGRATSEIEAGPGDLLFEYARSNPVLERNLAQIYRDHF